MKKIGILLRRLIGALTFITVLIIVHELGHYAVARWNGVGIDRFSIFFGKPIITRVIGETEFAVGWIPLGGCNRYMSRELFSEMALEDKERIRQQYPTRYAALSDPSRYVESKSRMDRFVIAIAGIAFNLASGLCLMLIIFVGKGIPITPLNLARWVNLSLVHHWTGRQSPESRQYIDIVGPRLGDRIFRLLYRASAYSFGLAWFNLYPIIPLDGAHLVELLTENEVLKGLVFLTTFLSMLIWKDWNMARYQDKRDCVSNA